MYIWASILVMFIVTYAIRVLPLTLIRKPIKNPFIQSFLYYVPYITLAVMTFPAIMHASNSRVAGLAAFIIGTVAVYKGATLCKSAVICCAVVFIIELFI